MTITELFALGQNILANPEHLAKLREGVDHWNHWKEQDPELRPDLSESDLNESRLMNADFSRADLRKAYLINSSLRHANLSRADLSGANLAGANLGRTSLVGTNLSGANLINSSLRYANLSKADLSGANLGAASLVGANLSGANLTEADLIDTDLTRAHLSAALLDWANLTGANLTGANLTRAHLRGATLVNTNLEAANLTDCSVYGISAWNLNLKGAIQSNLVITHAGEFPIQVDNLEVAQFIYLLLNNEKIRSVIDTITSKMVLILGRFTPDRKVVLDAIRDELRKRDYLPVLFDFEKPSSKDLTGTVSTLANMARFIIADLTDPSSVPHELATLVPGTVPVQAIILEEQREYAMFPDLMRRYHWVLEPHQYKSKELLVAHLSERVIDPAEAKAKELALKK